MDWADDVAYSVHDLEDGLHAGLVSLKNLTDSSERTVVSAVAVAHYCPASWHVTAAELETVFAEFITLDCWQFTFDAGPASLAAAKNLTSELVGRLCRAGEDATLAAAAAPPGTAAAPRPADSVQRPGLRRYDADLVVPRRQRLECALLKAVAAHYVMSREGVAAQQSREREVITELALAIERGAPAALEPVFQPAWDGASDDEERRRVIIDQVAALTDTSALAWHARLALSTERPPQPRWRASRTTSRTGLAAETLRAEGYGGALAYSPSSRLPIRPSSRLPIRPAREVVGTGSLPGDNVVPLGLPAAPGHHLA